MVFNLLEGAELIKNYGNVTLAFSALYGPLLFLYIKSLQLRDFNFTRYSYLHLLPFFLLLLVAVTLPKQDINSAGLIIIILLYAYLIASIITIRRYQKIIKQTQSRYDGIALKWSIQVILACMVVVFMDLFNSLFQLNVFQEGEIFFVFVLISLLVFVNMLVIKGLRQPALFAGISVEEELIFKETQTKYVNSIIAPDEITEFAARVKQFYEDQKPYLDLELDLVGLSKMVGLNPRQVSQAINTVYQTNFSDFTNDFRIEEAKVHLADSNMNITEILYEVGFNSKSSFYAYFKKKTGISPTQYRKNLNS